MRSLRTYRVCVRLQEFGKTEGRTADSYASNIWAPLTNEHDQVTPRDHSKRPRRRFAFARMPCETRAIRGGRVACDNLTIFAADHLQE
jgi:hypothetical protein